MAIQWLIHRNELQRESSVHNGRVTMKLLFVIRDAHGWAGTERVLNLVSNALSDRHEVEILSLSPRPSGSIGYRYEKGIKRSYFPVSPGVISVVASNFRIAAFVGKSDYDAVVLAGIGEIKYFLLATLLHSTKIVAWEHFNAAYTHKRFNRKFAARYCDAIIVLTSQDSADWRRLLSPKARIVHIPNPVPNFPDHTAALTSKRILALGRLEEQKRFDLLLDAYAIFSRTHQDWRLRIRGSGSKEKELRLKVVSLGLERLVEILDPTFDVDAEYSNASLYAMSSKFEGFPMTLLEAMAYGVPCVSFFCPNGPSEIIHDGEDGYVVRQGDVAALASRMNQVADDENLRRRMGEKARENIGRYDVGRITDLWAAFFEELCAR